MQEWHIHDRVVTSHPDRDLWVEHAIFDPEFWLVELRLIHSQEDDHDERSQKQ